MLIISRNISDGITGANVRDSENRMRNTKEGAERLGQSIRSGMTGNSISPNRNQYRISKAASTMATNVADNTVELQKIMEQQGDETKSEISKLLKMMMEAQKLTGDKSVNAIREIIKQTEKITIAAGESGESVKKLLGIDSVQKQLYGGSIRQRAVSATKGLFDIDKEASFGESVKQAFEPSRLFGDSGFFGLGAKRNQRINAIREAKIEAANSKQFSGISSAMEDLGVSQERPKKTDKGTLGTKSPSAKSAIPLSAVSSGLDRKSLPEEQTDLLTDILKELKKLNEKEFGGGGVASAIGGLFAKLFKAFPAATAAYYGIKGLDPQFVEPGEGGMFSVQDEEFEKSFGNTSSAEEDPNTGITSDTIERIQKSSVTPSTEGSLIKRGPAGSTVNGPIGEEGQEYIINIDGVEKQVSKEEFNAYYDSITNSQASTNVLPTAAAVEGSTDASTNMTVNAPVINNITNNNGGSSTKDQIINVVKDSIRDNTPAILRKISGLV